MSPATGCKLLRHEVLGTLGAGATGEAYRACDTNRYTAPLSP